VRKDSFAGDLLFENFEMTTVPKPFMLKEAEYKKGDKFVISVDYFWLLNGARDYTVKVYSKLNLKVKDKLGRTKMLYTDAVNEPTEFTKRKYK
jgi:hypothetical protein